MNRKKPLLYDTQIIGRVEKCLTENSSKTLADFRTVTRLLQAKYPEYRRRRQGPFRQLVKQAYGIVYENLCKDFNLHESENAETDTESEQEQEQEVEAPQKNILNNLFKTMYKQQPPNVKQQQPKTISKTNEKNNVEIIVDSISISSDEYDTTSKSDKLSATDGNKSSDSSSDDQRENENTTPVNILKKDDFTMKCNEEENTAATSSQKRKPSTATTTELKPKRNRNFKKSVNVEVAKINFENIAGIDGILKNLCEMLISVVAPEMHLKLGAKPPNGILIYGQTGCGKTTLAEAIAGQLEFGLIKVPATELVAGISGESEERIREVFEQTILNAPCVLFIDDIDAIGTNRVTAQKEMQSRITSQLLNSLDTLKEMSWNARILVIGATSRPDVLDAALRRPGRFDYEICIPVPDRQGRLEIIRKLSERIELKTDFDCNKIAELTPGYVAADLKALFSRAGTLAVKRLWFNKLLELEANKEIIEEVCDSNEKKDIENEAVTVVPNVKQSNKAFEPTLAQLIEWLENPPQDLNFENYTITMEDFLDAIKVLQPSAKREGFITVPDITWSDIGSLHDIRNQLRLAILAPVKYPNAVQRLGLLTPTGVLLCGPPGCGKTLIAKAIANEAGINFISVKGPEMMNMYVGESERAVRECFQRARNSAPCVIFFDEFDSLCPKRSSSTEGSSGVRIVNQLLTEMDGVEERKGVYILAATNRPDIIDPAILRPGRLDNILYIGMPDVIGRSEILRATTKNGQSPMLSNDVDFNEIAKLTDGYTGADLSGLIRQASQLALKHAIANNIADEHIFVSEANIKEAMKIIRPSISGNDRKVYEDLRLKYAPKDTSA